ncbi:MAG TPA: response regulator [Planctomycetaceae bacterium]|nr:response regulator [Planctomycetaceae bacterium]
MAEPQLRFETADEPTAEELLRARNFELEVLYELSQKIGYSLSFEELFRAILTHLEDAITFDVAVGLLDADGGSRLFLRQVQPLALSALSEVETRLLNAFQRLGGHSHDHARPTVVPIDGKADGRRSGPPIRRLASYFQVPIIADGVTMGIICLGSEAPNQFTLEQVRLLYTVANQASGAVQRLRAVLQSEERRLELVVKYLPEGIVLLDRFRRLILANPAGHELLDQAGRFGPSGELLDLGDLAVETFLVERPEGGLPTLQIGNAPARFIEPVAVPLETDLLTGCWILMLRDVTESREAISRRDRFLAMLAHELRNPLAPLLNASRLLREDVGAEVHEQARDVINRQSRHLARLVDDLFDVSRFLHGKITLQMEPVDLRRVIVDSVETHRKLIEANEQTLTVDVAADPMWVLGDSVRLVQIVSNLLSNSAKYTPARGRIEVSCRRVGAKAEIRVRDTGQGIEPAKLNQVFDPFMQIGSQLPHAQTGLGLGLALVRNLVDLHCGEVTAQSAGLNQGSEFTVRFPLTDSPADAEDDAQQALGVASARILVIEDLADTRDTLCRLLELHDHHVWIAADGPEGIDAWIAHRPDVALIDIGLPGTDGYEVARRIRDEPGGQETLLIALTGFTQPEDQRRAREAGFDAHLAKPVDVEELQRLIVERQRVARDAHESRDGEIPVAAKPYRVLVVDDMRDILHVSRAMLSAAGHDVRVATTADEALELARTHRPQIVVSDIGLPGPVDGYGLARKLRSEAGLENAYLIAITAYAQDHDRRKAMEAGFNLHLAKPVDYVNLVHRIARLKLPSSE